MKSTKVKTNFIKKASLLTIFLLPLFLGTSKVKALSSLGTDYSSDLSNSQFPTNELAYGSYRCAQISDGNYEQCVNFERVYIICDTGDYLNGNTNGFYCDSRITKLKIGDGYGFCIDEDLHTNTGACYVSDGQMGESYRGVSKVLYQRAYAYAKHEGFSDEAYATAQAYIWAGGDANNFKQYVYKFYISEGYSGADAQNIAQQKLDIFNNVSLGDIYIYYPKGFPSKQKFITDVPPKKTTNNNCSGPSVNIKQCAGSTFDDSGTETDWSNVAGVDDYLENSNDYCKVYCQEHAQSSLNADSKTFKAGRYFVIGKAEYPHKDGDTYDPIYGPIAFIGTRYCKTYYADGSGLHEGINTNQFINDYNDIVNKIKQDYASYRQYLAEKSAVDDIISRKENGANFYQLSDTARSFLTSNNCYAKSTTTERVCADDTQSTCNNAICHDSLTGDSVNRGEDYCAKATNITVTSNDQSSWTWGTYYPGESYSWYDANGIRQTKTISASCDAPVADSSVADEYENDLATERSYISELSTCSSMVNTTTYNFNPVVSAKYETDNRVTKYTYSNTLVPTVVEDSSNNTISGSKGTVGNYYSSYCSGLNCFVREYTCGNSGCTYGSQQTIFNANAQVIEKTMNKYINYYASNTGFQYSNKTDGYTTNSMMTNNTSVDIKAQVIPLDYYMSAGVYHITFSYYNVGNYKNGTYHFDNAIRIVNNNNSTISEVCPLNVDTCPDKSAITDQPTCVKACAAKFDTCGDAYKNCLVDSGCCKKTSNGGMECPKPTGLNLVYRTIQLQSDNNNAATSNNLSDQAFSFPSYDGNGRTPGANWNKTDTYNGNPNTHIGSGNVTAYITYNRNVHGNDVYNKEPIYQITLTPSLILQIRKYNREEIANNNGGYADFDKSMTCDSNGVNCTSSFIHSMYRSYFSGTCMNISNDNSFDSCRY